MEGQRPRNVECTFIVSAMHANRFMNQKRHYPRRPVTIIRRAVPNKNNKRMNPIMRASSAMFTPMNRVNRHSLSPNQNPYTHNKIGLAATPRFRADVKDSAGGNHRIGSEFFL
eukprot:503905_1